ncbi:hypothetical protein ACFDR9_004379 [Janthinobacterium sp. CG_23.3]|uniref:hypothetical protein n=1 Tax=Janthinobacterium sp. CG_23.3 TaxID=3349634 RepID=UPI0038D36919
MSVAVTPDTWSIEPLVIIRSKYVAEMSNKLLLERSCCSLSDAWIEPASAIILRFLPAHLRWQENYALKYPTLDGRLETLPSMADEFIEVFERYVEPILSDIGNPYDLAQFQLQALTGLRSSRLTVEQPRYNVYREYISTAILFYEAGRLDLAIDLLAEVQKEKISLSIAMRDGYADQLYCQVDKLMKFFLSLQQE